MNVVFTFHISFSLEHDEGITPTATVLVADNSNTLDRPKTFEFTSEIALCRVLWLERYIV